MSNPEVRDIIHSFYGKHYRKEVQMRFRFWLRREEEQAEKEKIVQEIWEQTPSVVSERTWDSLARLQSRIDHTPAPSFALRFWLEKGRKYAAVILLMLLSSLATLWLRSLIVGDAHPLYTEYFVPYGESRELTLPDSSKVWMNAGSLLVYPESFSGKTRSIYLSGEARFEVSKNPRKPFIVHTHKLDVEALGTIFNMQAYPNKAKIVATLEEGSVRVTSSAGEFDPCILRPDEQLVYSRQTRQAVVHPVEATEFSSWKDGYLLFEDCSFEEIAAALERKYKVMIQYDAQKYRGRSFYVKFGPDETLEDALNVLSGLIEHFHYRIVQTNVFIN